MRGLGFSDIGIRRLCSCRDDIYLHPHARVGRRRSDLVRGGTADSACGHRCARDRRDMQARTSLPRRKRRGGARSSRQTSWRQARDNHDGAYTRRWPDTGLSIGGIRQRRSDSGVVQRQAHRSFMRNGSERLCSSLGSILAGKDLSEMTFRAGFLSGFAIAVLVLLWWVAWGT